MIGFVYSVFQFAALVGLMRKDKHLISHPKRDLFDFAMDQVCAPPGAFTAPFPRFL